MASAITNNAVYLSAPPNGIIVRPNLRPGEKVFVKTSSTKLSWEEGKVICFIDHSELPEQEKYLVETGSYPVGDNGRDEQEEEKRRKLWRYPRKMLAYTQPHQHSLPVGLRIVAKRPIQVLPTANAGGVEVFPGIIIEHLKKVNGNYRYLIFFDDGRFDYFHPAELFLVCGSSTEVWKDLPPTCADFVKEYLLKYPEVPLAKLSVGQLVSTSLNGNWVISRVLQIRGSLAKVSFYDDDKQCCWMYRGFKQFNPVTKKMVSKLENRTEPSGPTTTDYLNSRFLIEYQGTLSTVTVPSPDTRQPIPHECDCKCTQSLILNDDMKRSNPLLVPLNFGWSRNCEDPGVVYRSPCGVLLKTEEDLAHYLDKTNSEFSADYFSFSVINCFGKFEPTRIVLKIEDLSRGIEAVPVLCINSLNTEAPPDFTYTRASVPGKNVEINRDKNFLTSCTCKDNCLKKDNCACWKLTIAEINLQRDSEICGYKNRKLVGPVDTVMYECNYRCTCKKTCSNKTSQNGARWPLQVFKTAKTGWGVRTLFDIPKGTFLFNYVGEILRPEVAALRDDVYIACLGLNDTQGNKELIKMMGENANDAYAVDAMMYGNVTRFINHSCEPNVIAQKMLVDTHDVRFPSIGIFTSKIVHAGTELRWDYNYALETNLEDAIQCFCGSLKCRKRLC